MKTPLISRSELAEKLDQYQRENLLTIRELSRRLDIPEYTLYRWRHQQVDISNVMFKYLKSYSVV